MTEQEKKKTANLEDMQAFGRVIHNKGIGSEGTCSTAAGTAAKTVTVGTTFSPVAGATLIVLFQNGISVASPTLAVTYTDGSGTQQTLAAKPIYYRGAAIAADMVKEGAKIILRYDGTNFNVVGDLDQSHLSVPLSQKGSAGGVASLDENGMVPSEQLPSYVDDVVELLAITDTAPEHCTKGDLYFNTTTKKVVRATATDTWGTGSTTNTDPEKGKIYVDLTDDKTYRWGGTAMVPISNPTIPKTDGITGSTVNRYSECSTAAGTAAKTASITAGTFSLEKGARVTVAFANENTADNPTLNINNTGAKSIYIQGEQVTTDDSKGLLKGTCDFVYNGSAWDMVAGAGGGGGESVFGKIRVSLTALVNGVAGSASLLNGVTVTLMNTTDNVQVGVQTWAGEQIVFQKLTPQKNYSVTVSAKTGFKTPSVQTVTNLGIGEEVSKTFQYEALEYTVEMTSNQDTQQTQDADLDRTASGVYLTAQYTYGGETVAFGSQLHNGDTVLIPSDTDISTLSITASSSPSGYSKEASVDNTNKKLSVAYSTTKVFLAVTASQGDVVTGNTFKINGTNITPNDNTSFVKVPTGDSITVTAPDVSGYGKVITGGGTASGTSQTVTATYTYGVLRLTVAMSDASAADLANVAPQISVNSGAAVAMTGSGGVFELNLDVNDTYEITFNSLVAAGYQTPSSISGTFGGGLEEKSATYQTTVLTLVSITTTKDGNVQGQNPQDAGVTVTYTGQTSPATLTPINDAVKVPSNLTPTITPTDVQYYSASSSLSSNAISVTYATVSRTVGITSNQTSDAVIAAVTATLTYSYGGDTVTRTGIADGTEVLIPATATGIAFTGPDVAGYARSVSGATVSYATEILTVALASDTGLADLSDVTITVTDTTAPATVSPFATRQYKIPSGHGYSVSVSDDVEGYSAPTAATGTAAGGADAAQTVTMTYTEAPGFIDLGLPSGMLWATGNLVKDSQGNYGIGGETDYGTYVSWGNIVGHNEDEGYNFDQTTYDSTTGASVSADIPAGDAAHDIALATLGSPWHLPTKADIQELYDNTDNEWVADYNGTGVAGRKFMKKSDHSVYVFFPASGYRYNTSLSNRGSEGYYWSASFKDSTDAYSLWFFISAVYPQNDNARLIGFTVRPVTLPYAKLTLNIQDSEGSPISGLTVGITDVNTTYSATTNANGQIQINVAKGTVKVQVYGKVSNVSNITVSGTTTVSITATDIPMAYIKIDQTKSDDTQMITVSETQNGAAQTLDTTTGRHANAALQALRDSSHLYMGKYADGTMAVRQLKDDDGTKYADDNSTANMDGTDGDHFLRINTPFYVKRVSGSDSGDQVTYGLAVGGQPDSTWKQIISPDDLLGVHEATASDTGDNTNGVLYSKSGGDSSGNISQPSFKQKARNKGTGFTLVTWEWHCMMAILFYGWYGRTNAQAVCGTGADASSGATRYTGLKDSLGMQDTDTTNGNTDNIKFWGIENWWGCKSEWFDNVVVDARVWKVTDKAGNQRTAGTGASTTGEIQKMLLSENADLIPTAVVSNSGYNTYYCDYNRLSLSSSLLVRRSGQTVTAGGGVAYVDANFDSSSTYANTGSRLAFSGAVEDASVMKLRFKTANDAAVAGVTVTVTMPTGTESHVTDSNGEVTIFTIAGSTCTVSARGYDLNVSQFTVVAGSTVTVTATVRPMTTGYIILDQTSSDPTMKVIDEDGHTYSGYSRPAVITAIRNASHCYVGEFSNGTMTLKQLDDTDGTKYADGTSAASDITSKDVFMRLPIFFTRVSEYATDKIKIEFAFDPSQVDANGQIVSLVSATPAGNGWKQWGGNDLIGKYEAYETSSKTYSQSGKTSTASVSQADFKSHARARGTGFTIVKWRHQNIMAILFYAYYGHTNCQSLIGSGASSNNKQTGLKNSLGMTDTTSANGNTDNIVFWGLENWWGNKYEWVDNVVVNSGTWTITEDDGSTRTLTAGTHVMTAAGSWVYPSKFYLGDDLDTVGAVGQTGGSDSTGYCDGQYIANDSSRVVARSFSYADAYGGVAYVLAHFDSSSAGSGCGSRLAFTGTIEIS